MESMHLITSLIFILMFIVLLLYHMYYCKNIKYITKQLKEIMSEEDTNQLLTMVARQKDIDDLVNVINNLIKNIRLSRIRIARLNNNFKQGITNIAHDIRTPLTTASGYVQMLQKSITEKEMQDYLNIVLERQNMVKILLEELFEYARIESGEITYKNLPVDSRKIFIDTITMYYDDFYKKGHEPIINVLDNPCIINGDEHGLKRIFSNVIYNAIIHGNGQYSFEIKKSDNKYVFTFSNSSEPMTRDELDYIFDRLYTMDKSRNSKTTGLGLAIAKKITIRLSGSIEAFYDNGRFFIVVSFPCYKN